MFSKGLILASTSRYRRALLGRLGLPFDCVAPQVEEARQPGESPVAMAARLARLKAEAVSRLHPAAVVIGSDQVALRGSDVLGKPGTVERCREQLQRSSGRDVVFLTAVHVVDGPAGRAEAHVDRTTVLFRELSADEIDRYIERDRPLDCAGGFKAESLGIALFEKIDSSDPTGLTGLPLAWVCGALRRAGLRLP
ncbi:MAG: maf protein [Steroidobacteraceae bacterium]|nr:maf protein [Steroidobacteraceae bacterium]